MQGLNFDDGFRSFPINNDPNRVIRFNPTDIGIVERISDAYKRIDTAAQQAGDIKLKADGSPLENIEGAAEKTAEFRREINGAIDDIFNAPIADIAFGRQSPVSLVNGRWLYEEFLEALCKLIESEMNVQIVAAKKRRSKYTNQAKKVFHR